MLFDDVFGEVHEGVDVEADLGVLGVVAMAHADVANDSVALADNEAVLFPDRQSAHGRVTRCLHLLVALDHVVLIFDVGVSTEGADGLSASTNTEVGKFAWHLRF